MSSRSANDQPTGGTGARTTWCRWVSLGMSAGVLTLALVGTLPASAAAPTWVPSAAPTTGLNPPAAPGLYLLGTSCASPTSCVAVGDYLVASSETAEGGVIEVGTLTQGVWKWKASTAPTGGLTPPAVSTDAVVLEGVSCPSATLCIATGTYNAADGAVGGVGLIEAGTRSGKVWSWVPSSAPTGGLNPPANSSDLVSLTSVSCGSATNCVAAGFYNGYNEGSESVPGLGLLEAGTLEGSTWTWVPSSAPMATLSPRASDSPNLSLNGLACGSASVCVAVGAYGDIEGGTDGVIETGSLGGSGWTWKDTTAPTSALTDPTSEGQVVLSDVACPSITSCMVGGSYAITTSGQRDGLFEVGTKTKAKWNWTPDTAPTTGLTPAAGSGDVGINGVSCPTATTCVAGGEYRDFTGDETGLGLIEVATQSAGMWSWAPSNAPVTGLKGAAPSTWVLFAMSCGSPTTCVGAGYYERPSGDGGGLFEAGTLPS
jgi:hypothetical protein